MVWGEGTRKNKGQRGLPTHLARLCCTMSAMKICDYVSHVGKSAAAA